jgi:hypothetical protein
MPPPPPPPSPTLRPTSPSLDHSRSPPRPPPAGNPKAIGFFENSLSYRFMAIASSYDINAMQICSLFII